MLAGSDLRSPVSLPGERKSGIGAALAILTFLCFAVAIPLILRSTSEATYSDTDFLIHIRCSFMRLSA